MILVLIRHGQAKDRSRTGEDRDRRLTNAGIRATRASLPRILSLLPRRQRISIWSSPYRRAQQTAELLEEALLQSGRLKADGPAGNGASGTRLCESLAEPGFDGVLSDISLCLTNNETDILFLVGHDPQFSSLAEFLTGSRVPFRKGSALCAEIRESSGGTAESPAELRWFVQGPDARRWETLIELEKILRNGYRRVETAAGRFAENPDDPDAVHDFRVAIRSLRALVSFVEPFQKKKQNRGIQSGLREAAARLSRLREYDVLLEESAQVDIDLAPFVTFCDANASGNRTSDPGGGIVPPRKLDAELRALREAERDQVLSGFSKFHAKPQSRRLPDAFRSIEWRGRVESEGLDAEELRTALQESAGRFSESFAELDLRDEERAHKIRKRAKQIRYVNSSLKPILGPHPEITRRMTEIQDHLGALCDARVNAALLEDMIRCADRYSEVTLWQARNLLAIERRKEEEIVAPWASAQAGAKEHSGEAATDSAQTAAADTKRSGGPLTAGGARTSRKDES